MLLSDELACLLMPSITCLIPLLPSAMQHQMLYQVLFALLLLVDTTSGRAVLSVREDEHRGNSDPSQAPPCNLVGNPDLYGLRIRLGVYLQLLSILLANHFLPDALREAWDANAVFRRRHLHCHREIFC